MNPRTRSPSRRSSGSLPHTAPSWAVLTLVVLALLASASPRANAAELLDLGSLEELQALVDSDKTMPRLVLLLSPT
jgi:hypothetical protein